MDSMVLPTINMMMGFYFISSITVMVLYSIILLVQMADVNWVLGHNCSINKSTLLSNA
jgi:hypothetical protein